MVQDIVEAPCYGDFIVTIRCPLLGTSVKVWASVRDTILSIKEFMGDRLELFSDEMTVLVSQTCPYPLSDSVLLSRLLVEHRHLTLIVHEGKEICYGVKDEDEDEDAWLGQSVPDRYVSLDNSKVLDFRYLSDRCIPRIRAWLYKERDASEIWLLGTHPKLMDILYAIAEHVLGLGSLVLIVIQNPMSPTYTVPYKSHARNACNGTVSTLERCGLSYLYQHLLLDQYRASAEEVEIWVDGGLLPGVAEGFRFLP